jgi:short-subunit dehydrogenase
LINYRLALVTGASSGIGKEVCELFAQKGISLIISGRNLSELQHLHEKLCQRVNVQTVQADLGTSLSHLIPKSWIAAIVKKNIT